MVKIYGIRELLGPKQSALAVTIHQCLVEAFGMPSGKRAQRFFPMAREDFLYPEGRSDAYTVIELTIMSGRTVETKKRLVRLLFERIASEVGIEPNDVEITLLEAPPENWGFRGLHGDEATLPYAIKV